MSVTGNDQRKDIIDAVGPVTVRRATVDDAALIAQLRIDSWRDIQSIGRIRNASHDD